MLGLLFEKRFDEYFAAFRQDLGLLVFSHVPKTAGSSLRAEIARVLKPEANIFLDYNDKTRTYMQGLDDAGDWPSSNGTGNCRTASPRATSSPITWMPSRGKQAASAASRCCASR